ncbi:MAG TPA: DUF2254 domain-containing protein [Steroidobacteraceae bacterium]
MKPLLGRLAWNRAYRTVSYLRSTLWVVPLVAILLELVVIRLLHTVDHYVAWDLTGLDVAGATTLFEAAITLTLSFIIFTFGSLLVAIQIAGGQLTPRIIATTLLRDRVIKYTVGLNVFTLLFAISGLNRMAGEVNQLVTLFAAILGIACLASFLFLIDYAARLLRPVRIVALVSDDGMAVIRDVYPLQGADTPTGAASEILDVPARVVNHKGTSQIVLAVDADRLVAAARRLDGVIEFVPQVGDFVAADEPLFRLYGGAAAIDDKVLRHAAAFGPERTMEQDPMFAFRILVDIALKALSPAINDPTTAVLAIDQIHRLLRYVGLRQLHGNSIADAGGKVRVLLRTPDWRDFVHVACNEIRACGIGSMQIVRRQRAMLENLMRTLPPERHQALRTELEVLDRQLEDVYKAPEDLALARVADAQGLGGAAMRHA